MPEVRVSFHLPYVLALDPGEYPTPALGGSIHLTHASIPASENTAQQTIASLLFYAGDNQPSST